MYRGATVWQRPERRASYENDVYRAMQDVVPPIDLKKLDVFEQLGRPKEASVTGVN